MEAEIYSRYVLRLFSFPDANDALTVSALFFLVRNIWPGLTSRSDPRPSQNRYYALFALTFSCASMSRTIIRTLILRRLPLVSILPAFTPEVCVNNFRSYLDDILNLTQSNP